MKPKAEEKSKAIELRLQGETIPSISQQLSVSKGSVSTWVRGVELSPEHRSRISRQATTAMSESLKSRRIDRYDGYLQEANREFIQFKDNPKFMFGLALYVGEGDKANPHRLVLSNCDAYVIQAIRDFYRLIGVPETKIVVNVHLHVGGDVEASKRFWSNVVGIEEMNVSVYSVTTKSSQNTKGNIQAHGCCRLIAALTPMKQKVNRWMVLALGKDRVVV